MVDHTVIDRTDAERLAWGAAEDQARKADVLAVKTGAMSLETAQKNARRRARQSGMTAAQAYRAFIDAQLAPKVST